MIDPNPLILGAFISDVEGQCVDLNEAPGDCQCVGLADAWAVRIGRPLPLVRGAKDFIGTSPDGWRWVANTPDNFPDPGSLVVWDSRIGVNGHIDLCIGQATTFQFPGLDQNWDGVPGPTGGTLAKRITHGYTFVAGWLVPVTQPAGGGPPVMTPPFYVNTHADAVWRDHPDGNVMGSAPNLTKLRIIEVVNDGASDWYRWDGGLWWIVNTQCDVVAAPGPVSPPATDLEAEIHKLKVRLDAMVTAGQG